MNQDIRRWTIPITAMVIMMLASCVVSDAQERIFRRGNMVMKVDAQSGGFELYYQNTPLIYKTWNKIITEKRSYRLAPDLKVWTSSGVDAIQETPDEVVVRWRAQGPEAAGTWGIAMRSGAFSLLYDLAVTGQVTSAEIGYYLREALIRGGTAELDKGRSIKLSWDYNWPDETLVIATNAYFFTDTCQLRVSNRLPGSVSFKVEDRRKTDGGYYFRIDASRSAGLVLKGELCFELAEMDSKVFLPKNLKDFHGLVPASLPIPGCAEIGANLEPIQGGIPFTDVSNTLHGVVLKPGDEPLRINQTGNYAAIYVLGMGDNIPAGKEALRTALIYQDGTRQTRTLKAVDEFQNFIDPAPGPGRLVTQNQYLKNGTLVGLAVYQIESDKTKPLAGVEFQAGAGTIALLGVTPATARIPLVDPDIGGQSLIAAPPLNVAVLPHRIGNFNRCGISRVSSEFKQTGFRVSNMDTNAVVKTLAKPWNIIMVVGDRINSTALTYSVTQEAAQPIRQQVVEQGVGLLVARELNAETATLNELLPVEAEGNELVDVRNQETLITFLPDSASHPLFEFVRWQYFPAVLYYYKAKPKKGAQVLARFSNGDPAYVTWTVGKGRVLWSAMPVAQGAAAPGWSEMDDLFRDTVPFYARLAYWLAGNDAYARQISVMLEGRLIRGELGDAVARFYNKAETVGALTQYAGTASNQFNEITATAAAAFQDAVRGDILHGRHDYSRSKTVWQNAKTCFEESSGALDKIERQCRRRLRAYAADPGQKIIIGPHHDDWLWSDKLQYKPSNVTAHRYRREQDYLRDKALFDFNLISLGLSQTYFLRDDCDPAVIDEKDFQLDIYDHFLDIARKYKAPVMIFAMQRNYGVQAAARHDRMFNTPECDPTSTNSGSLMIFWNDTVRQRRHDLLKVLAGYFGQFKDLNIAGLQRDNENGGLELREPVYIERFQRFLADKYGQITNANVRYRGTFHDFQAIVPPTYEQIQQSGVLSSTERAVWRDWREFVDRENLLYYKAGYDGIKAGATNVPASARFSFNSTSRGNKPICLPYEQVIQYYDIAGGQHHSCEEGFDYVVGTAGNRFKNMSEYYTAVERPSDKAEYIPGYNASLNLYFLKPELPMFHAACRQMWHCFARGVESFQIHAVNMRWMVVNPLNLGAYEMNLTPRLMGLALKYAKWDFERMNGVMEGSKPVFQGGLVTVRHSHYQIPGTYVERTKRDYYDANMTLRAFFMRHHYRIDQVPEDKDYASYPVMIFHQAEYMSPATAEKVLNYVRAGGVLISVGAIEQFDDYSFPAGRLLREFGVDGAALGSASGDIVYDDGIAKGQLKNLAGEMNVWRFTVRPDGPAKVLARYADGAAGLVETEYGKGRVYLLGYDWLGMSERYDCLHKMLYEHLFTRHLPPGALTVDQPDVHIYVRRTARSGELYFVTNNRLEPLSARLTFRAEAKVVDCKAAVEVPQKDFSYQFQPGECRVFLVE